MLTTCDLARADELARFAARAMAAAGGRLILRWECQHATIWAGLGGLAYIRKRLQRVGRVLAVTPIRPEDLEMITATRYVLIRYRATSPRRRRFEQRERLKAELGSRGRKLVGQAGRQSLARFTTSAAEFTGVLAARGYTPRQFWRLANCREWLPAPVRQLELFATE